MGSPHLSDELNAIVDGQYGYASMRLGEILEITAVDATTSQPGNFQIQIVAFMPSGRADMPNTPIFRFWNMGEFSLYGPDRRTPFQVKNGSLAGAGCAATHVPEFRMSMIGFGGIGRGRDYSFEFLNGQPVFVYADSISVIKSLGIPKTWRGEPKKTVKAYLERVKRTEARDKAREEAREKRLQVPLRVQSVHSIYHLSAPDSEGIRTMTREGTGETYRIKLLKVRVGSHMWFDYEKDGQWLYNGSSSTVANITPDPDRLRRAKHPTSR